ncbi:hypothetical protein RB623_29310 [Mesorhizobium sp. LHD-90]|uniref:hypothetical protein n=1 Tax=Mesorhizobium sp. LHD-90 TaxID=3071414 RepID=UPI0027E0288D|nr:hypothetical protein [Mesorhizobium sp. LHD-90]MDQ6438172.1 hypothetical protein [Mesorhizobium sp. LHD-90]
MPSFFNKLWPSKPDAYISTWTKNNKVQFFHTSQADRAERYLHEQALIEDVYFGVGLLAQPPQRGRGSANDVSHLPGFFMDWDVKQPGNEAHAKTELPGSVEDVYTFMDEIGLARPSVVINSGNGIHTYYVMENALDLRDPDTRAKTATGLRQFQRAIIDQGKALRGWKLDNTADLARVLRWPGTFNHKTNPPKRVEMI